MLPEVNYTVQYHYRRTPVVVKVYDGVAGGVSYQPQIKDLRRGQPIKEGDDANETSFRLAFSGRPVEGWLLNVSAPKATDPVVGLSPGHSLPERRPGSSV